MIYCKVPGSKSITNRALLIAAIAKGTSVLRGCLVSEDTLVMKRALKQLGISVVQKGTTITIKGGTLRASKKKIDCKNAGTAMRFLAAVLATCNFESTLDGSPRMRERPIADLVEALKQLGAQVRYLGTPGFPPIAVRGPLRGGSCVVNSSVSSQYLSGLLIAAVRAQENVTLLLSKESVSLPYIEITLAIMKDFGVKPKVTRDASFHIKHSSHYKARPYFVEGDATAATYFWGLQELVKSSLYVENIYADSVQGDACYELAQNHLQFNKSINCTDIPDAAMTLSVVCSTWNGTYRLSGLSNLRVKECDRLSALAKGLRAVGAEVFEDADGLTITGGREKLHGALIETYDDHRIAMCFGMLGVIIDGIKIDNLKCVSKTYPNFWHDLEKVKKALREQNIVLSGMRGSGKSHIGSVIAQKLGREFIDIDTEIEKKVRMSITKYVEKNGWPAFRKVESRVVASLKGKKSAVIASGGGTLIDENNYFSLRDKGTVIYLSCPMEILKKRLQHANNRPSLSGNAHFIDELANVFKKRKEIYKMHCDVEFDVSHTTGDYQKDVQDKAENIIMILGGKELRGAKRSSKR